MTVSQRWTPKVCIALRSQVCDSNTGSNIEINFDIAGASDPQAMLEGFRAFAKRPVQKKAPKAKGKGKSRVGEGYCPHAEKLLLPHELIREYLAKNGGKL